MKYSIGSILRFKTDGHKAIVVSLDSKKETYMIFHLLPDSFVRKHEDHTMTGFMMISYEQAADDQFTLEEEPSDYADIVEECFALSKAYVNVWRYANKSDSLDTYGDVK